MAFCLFPPHLFFPIFSFVCSLSILDPAESIFYSKEALRLPFLSASFSASQRPSFSASQKTPFSASQRPSLSASTEALLFCIPEALLFCIPEALLFSFPEALLFSFPEALPFRGLAFQRPCHSEAFLCFRFFNLGVRSLAKPIIP